MATGGFLLVCMIIFAQSSSELKDFSEAVPKTILNKNLDLGSIINKTNSTIFPYFTTIFAYNKSAINNKIQPLTDLENELEISNQLKGKSCTKNFTTCMREDPDYEPTLRHLTNFLYSNSPPFELSNVEGVSEDCKRASQKYTSDLKQYQMWALRMYDAAAKIPSGFLSGNTNQLGDFDLCLSARSEVNQIYGKYCLAAVQIETPHNPYLSAIHNRMHAHQSFKSKLGDPGHRVPRFSSIHWALCVPDQCTGKDVELGFRKVVDKILSKTDLEYKMEVDSNMCTSSKPTKSLNYPFIFASLFFILAFLIAASATLYDYFYENEIKNEWIMAFSLRKNILSMTSIKREQNDLEAVHGIRFINAVGLLLSHKSMALLFLPYVNRTQMSEIIGQPWTVIGRAASLYTDPFIMISGTLTAYSLFGRLQKNLKISILEEYTSRLLRILPTLSALILFCTFVLPYLNAGPMWNLVITHHSDICQKYWWRNLLFIHNYFGFKDMCLTHTHHVGIDTQLFFASPFLVLLVWKWPTRGTFTLISLATISTVMRYYVTYTRKLSNYVHFGTSVEQLFNTADYMYILPAHRVTVYIMGIFLGYILRNCKNVILKPIHINIGHIIAIACFIASFIGPSFMGNINYIYKPVHAAWYAAFAPILWCWSFAWIIFTCHIGYKGLIGNIFCFPYFKLWTKISYTVYLTQFPIFFYNVGTTRHSEYYDFIPKNVNVLETMCIFGLSALLTLLFESPFLNMKNIMFRRKPTSVKPQELVKKIS